MNVISGSTAPTVGETEAPPAELAPLKLVESGRMPSSAVTWRSPLPPRLAERLPKALKQGHERLVARWEEATAEAREARVEADKALETDNAATRTAVAAGKRPPAATEPALQAAADEASRIAQTHATMVLESGTGLVQALSEADLAAVVEDARGEAHRILEEEWAR